MPVNQPMNLINQSIDQLSSIILHDKRNRQSLFILFIKEWLLLLLVLQLQLVLFALLAQLLQQEDRNDDINS